MIRGYRTRFILIICVCGVSVTHAHYKDNYNMPKKNEKILRFAVFPGKNCRFPGHLAFFDNFVLRFSIFCRLISLYWSLQASSFDEIEEINNSPLLVIYGWRVQELAPKYER